jgi:pimeloyl-ACP methyl ester carboxylesterase
MALDSIAAKWSLDLLERHPGKNRYLLVEPTQNHNSRLIIYLHGLGNDLFFPQHDMFLSLVKKGYSILSVDLDGHGLDTTTQFSEKRIHSLMASVSQVVKKIKRNSCWFVGYSLGGVIGANGIPTCGLKFDGAIFIGAPDVNPPKSAMAWETLTVGKKSFYRSIFTYGIGGFIPALGEFGRQSFPVRLDHDEGEDYFAVARRIISQFPLFVSLKKLNIPVQICKGSLDHVASKLESIRNFCNQNPHVSYKILEGCTHHTTLLEPQLANVISNFIEEHLQQR